MSGAVSVSERTGHVICLGVVFFDGDVLVSATRAMRANEAGISAKGDYGFRVWYVWIVAQNRA